MNYYLKRKDEVVAPIIMDERGHINKYAKGDNFRREIAPLMYSIESDALARWWDARVVPISQGRVDAMLKRKGLIGPEEYLLRNLGLSLTDYYWICPADSNLKWTDVNLFDNDFKEDLFVDMSSVDGPIQEFTPNSSLQGELEKSWRILNGKRYLVKGNKTELSTESINEVIASEFHAAQGYDNYTEYELTAIPDKEYEYGCMSENFVTQELEYVSAYSILTSAKKDNSVSRYEHLIETAGNFGIDKEQFRQDLEYQILTDYLLTNRDRHMNNIGVLRDANTLQFLRMAPIYDTGKSMYVQQLIPSEEKMLRYQVNSFVTYERDQLKYVRNKDLVDVNKALPVERIRELYMKDNKMEIGRIDRVCKAYELKLKKFREM